MIHFSAIWLGLRGSYHVFQVKAKRAGEVIAERGDPEFFRELDFWGLPNEIAGPDEVGFRRFDLAEEVVDGGDELIFRNLQQQTRWKVGFAVRAVFAAEQMSGSVLLAHANHRVEEESIACLAIS